MTKEETEYVYRSVKNGTQVKPVHIDKIEDKIVDVSVNPYQEALTQELDSNLHEEPSLEMKRCDLTWSILSTEIAYITDKDNSPYSEMNTSNLYNKLQEDELDAAVDHAAVAQIMKAKTEPATTRIMRLLDRLSAYSFNLYYVKERDMILADYLSRHRHKDLDPSELIPISFCCLRTYRSLIDDRTGEEVFSVRTRAGAKAIGKSVGEVHGADKPLDPNYKPEHQSKSKLPSVIDNKSSPIKSVRKLPPQTPVRPTPRRVITPKSVRIQTNNTNDMPNIIQNPTHRQTSMVHGGARPKTKIVGTPMPLPSQTHTQPLIPRRILSSTPSGEKGEGVGQDRAIPRIIRDIKNKRREFEEKKDKLLKNLDEERRRIIEEQNRKIFHPPPIEGLDLGDGLETLDSEIRISTEEDFILPPPLESLLDKAKISS